MTTGSDPADDGDAQPHHRFALAHQQQPVWQVQRHVGDAPADCNLDLPLWQLVRASTAAPTFFPPEVVTFAEGSGTPYQFVFVDGGVTTYNNPAFLAYQMATAAPYGINWQTGADQMLIVSVGTGRAPKRAQICRGQRPVVARSCQEHPVGPDECGLRRLGHGCRTVGECRFGAAIDREFGDMVVDPANQDGDAGKLFSYVRYDPDVTADGLGSLGLSDVDPAHVQLMDSTDHIAEIQKVGTTYAARHVVPGKHFQGFHG